MLILGLLPSGAMAKIQNSVPTRQSMEGDFLSNIPEDQLTLKLTRCAKGGCNCSREILRSKSNQIIEDNEIVQLAR